MVTAALVVGSRSHIDRMAPIRPDRKKAARLRNQLPNQPLLPWATRFADPTHRQSLLGPT